MILKKNVDFIVIDFHAEITSEKMALAHFFDGHSTCIFGTHTHVPTADTRILEKGTAYQTDIGMCGDYNSVIGMNKENSIKKFFNDKSATNHFPMQESLHYQELLSRPTIKLDLQKILQE